MRGVSVFLSLIHNFTSDCGWFFRAREDFVWSRSTEDVSAGLQLLDLDVSKVIAVV